MKTFICDICGESGTSKANNALRHGGECRKIYYTLKRVKKVYHYDCKYCGEHNTSSKPYARVCPKRECKIKAALEYKKNKPKVEKEIPKTISVEATCLKCRQLGEDGKHLVEIGINENPRNHKFDFCVEHSVYRARSIYFEIPNAIHA